MNRKQVQDQEVDGWMPSYEDDIGWCWGCGKPMNLIKDNFDFCCFDCGHDDWIWYEVGEREVLSHKYIQNYEK